MLVLSRKVKQTITIFPATMGPIVIHLLRIDGDKAKIGIQADRRDRAMRTELLTLTDGGIRNDEGTEHAEVPAAECDGKAETAAGEQLRAEAQKERPDAESHHQAAES